MLFEIGYISQGEYRNQVGDCYKGRFFHDAIFEFEN
jgi:hypothetical protein